ncbi:hypothetical protein OPIT5_00245 (plasmid) [Opitutaceae bacterium TAV5]|nr:hypothetical protein OPIT5_00245 [Opitutaceae bacterium TAV5]
MENDPKPVVPRVVELVEDAMIRSAMAAGLTAKLARRAVYCDFDDGKVAHMPEYQGQREWFISDNFDRGFGTIIFRPAGEVLTAKDSIEGIWLWRDPGTGEDSPIQGGYIGAFAMASEFFGAQAVFPETEGPNGANLPTAQKTQRSGRSRP